MSNLWLLGRFIAKRRYQRKPNAQVLEWWWWYGSHDCLTVTWSTVHGYEHGSCMLSSIALSVPGIFCISSTSYNPLRLWLFQLADLWPCFDSSFISFMFSTEMRSESGSLHRKPKCRMLTGARNVCYRKVGIAERDLGLEFPTLSDSWWIDVMFLFGLKGKIRVEVERN